MTSFIFRLLINGAALWVADYLIDGIRLTNDLSGFFVVTLIFVVVNTLIKPIVDFFTCPVYVVTLGLFTFVVNALMLMLTAYLSGERLVVNDFWTAFLGSIVISLVSTLLSLFLGGEE